MRNFLLLTFLFLPIVFIFLIERANSYPENLSVTVEAGGPYVKDVATPKVIVVGEVEFEGEAASFANVTIKIYEGAILKATKELKASSEGKFFAVFHELDVGNYFVNVSANYSSINAYATDTLKITNKLYDCREKNVSLNGVAQDYMKGETISSGNVKIFIKENGDKFSTNFSGENWFVNFTSCLLLNQRHLLILQITDLETGRVSSSKIQFRV